MFGGVGLSGPGNLSLLLRGTVCNSASWCGAVLAELGV